MPLHVVHVCSLRPQESALGSYAARFRQLIRSRLAGRIRLTEASEPARGLHGSAHLGAQLAAADLVHLELGTVSGVDFLAAQRALSGRRPPRLVVTIHDPPTSRNRPLLGIFPTLQRLVPDRFRVPAVARVEQWMMERLKRSIAATIVLSRAAAADGSYFIPMIPFISFDPPVRPPRDDLRLLLLGFHSLSKGMADMVRAVRLLSDRSRDAVTLVLAGRYDRHWFDGSPVAVEERGFVPEPELPDLLGGVDAAVLPYRPIRGTSASGILAVTMPAGLMPIAADLDAVREEIKHERTGLLYPAADPAALAGAIEWAVAHRDRLPGMGRAAREDYLKRHDPDLIAGEMARIYEEAAG